MGMFIRTVFPLISDILPVPMDQFLVLGMVEIPDDQRKKQKKINQ
jgi:hypothetical protein